MKRVIAMFLWTALFLTCVISGIAAAGGAESDVVVANNYRDIPGVTPEDISAVEKLKAEKGSFTYGHLLETESFMLPDGTFAGFSIEVCRLLSELFGAEFVPVYYEEWEAFKTSLDNMEIDFTGCLTPTDERLRVYRMSAPIAEHNLKIYTHVGSDEITSGIELSGLKIGFMSGTVTQEMVTLPYARLSINAISLSSVSEAAEMLRTGAIDAFIIDGTLDPQFAAYDFIRSRELFWPVYTQVSVTTGNPELEPIITVIDKYLASGGTAVLEQLYEEQDYAYKRNDLRQALTEDEAAYIREHDAQNASVKIALEFDNYPFSFYNTEEQSFEGVVIDVLAQVSELTGISFENTATSTTPWTEITEDLKTGKISMVSHLAYSDERAKYYIWSTVPYSIDNYVLISKADFPQVKNHEIPWLKTGVFKGSIYEDIYKSWFPGSQNLVLYDSASEAFDALEKGEIDLVMGADFMLLAQTYYREKSGYVINYRFDASIESAMGFNKDEEILRSIIDKALSRIELKPISNFWSGRVFDYSEKIARQRILYLSLFATVMFLALVAMTLLFWKNNRDNKERKKAEQSLKTVMDTVPLPVGILDTETRNIVYGNDVFMRMMEIEEPEQLYALKGVDAFAPVQNNGMTSIELDEALADMKDSTVRDVLLMSASNKTADVRMHASRTDYNGRSSIIAIMTDLEKEREYRRMQEYLQTVLDMMPVPIRIFDFESGVITYVNNAAAEMFGLSSPEDAIGRDFLEFVSFDHTEEGKPPDTVKGYHSSLTPISWEFKGVLANGETIDVFTTACLVDYNGKKSSLGIMQNLTAEKEFQRKLIEAAEREKEANLSKSRFLANMSHEIRTPMNGIIGMTDLLLGDSISGRQLQYVKDIKTSAESLLGIINDILDLSKISEGKLKISPVDTELGVLLRNIVSMMGFSARTKGLNFIDDINISSPLYVRLDDVRLKQIVINLLSNAVKFTNQGYVRLSVKIENERIAIEVSDTGTGIKPEDIPQIFVAFEQVDTRKNRSIKGTGLGLSITASLVELMGGEIHVESVYGEGTTFFVTLPFEPGDESKIENPDMKFEYIYAPRAHVLLVDDIQTNLTVGAGLLRLCGITASVALSGEEAIELVKAKDYDLVFMDHMMPGLDGIEAMHQIRALGEKQRHLPIIALTANAVNESRDLLLESGMDDFLSKPVDKSSLINILKKWLPPDKLEVAPRLADGRKTEAYSEILDAAAKIDGLDIELALSRLGGLQRVLEKSLKQVAQFVEGKIKLMDETLSNGDFHGFSIEAHGLKGVLANVGATHNSELAAELEIAAKAGNSKLCIEKFSLFASKLENFAVELNTIFTETIDESRPQGDSQLPVLAAADAIDLLENFEAEDALNRLSELDNNTFGEEVDGILKEAKIRIETFSYDDAILILKRLQMRSQEGQNE